MHAAVAAHDRKGSLSCVASFDRSLRRLELVKIPPIKLLVVNFLTLDVLKRRLLELSPKSHMAESRELGAQQ